MAVETALFFETIEQIYARVFRSVRPRASIPEISVTYRPYANANSSIRLEGSQLRVTISDLLQGAPAPIQEALAQILISKLFRRQPEKSYLARYRRYFNRTDVRRTLHLVKQERGRKTFRDPKGAVYDMCELFEQLNYRYFDGLMARPQLGWSVRPSRTILGHYDPSHNAIVLTCLLDQEVAPELVVRYVLFHEMLHLRYPTQHRAARRCIHTEEFKSAEKLFDGYQAAKQALKAFVDRVTARERT
jgi:Protein of unknown function DUF45